MDKRLVADLIKTRKAVKQKYQSLKADIAQSQFELGEQYKPLTQPLKELISSIKSEGLPAKVEPPEVYPTPKK